MKDGIINVYKPCGMSSNDVIYRMRSILGIKKLGHTGTLDPLATGVLPVCINKATRVAEYMDVDFKTYRCTMILGYMTDTQDITGETVETHDVNVSEEEIRKAFTGFNGLIEQMPPMMSAVRVNGRRLYDIMRYGTKEELEIAKSKVRTRQIFIKNLEIEDISIPKVKFSVCCSKGTYIRTICQDVGEILGTGATMESLERIASGAFTKENSVTLEELERIAVEKGYAEYFTPEGLPTRLKNLRGIGENIPEEFEKYVYPCDYPLDYFGEATVSFDLAKKFIDGWHLSYREINITKRPVYDMPVDEKLIRGAQPTWDNAGSYPGFKVHPEYRTAYKIYREDGAFIGVAFHSDTYHKLVADKIFYRTEKNENI